MVRRWCSALLVTGACAQASQCDGIEDQYGMMSCRFFASKSPECPCFKGLGAVEACRAKTDPYAANADLACCGAITKEDWLCGHTHWDKCKGFVDGDTYAETQYGHLAYLCTTGCQELVTYNYFSGDPDRKECTGGLARQNRNCAEIQCTKWAEANPHCPCIVEVSKVYECAREHMNIDPCCDEFPAETWTCDSFYHDVCDLTVPWGQPGQTVPFEKLEDICVGWKETGEMPVWHEDHMGGARRAVLMLAPFLPAFARDM
jgi:hypothetical protein